MPCIERHSLCQRRLGGALRAHRARLLGLVLVSIVHSGVLHAAPQPQAQAPDERVPKEMVSLAKVGDAEYRLRLVNEVLNDTEEDPLFGRPGDFTITPTGRLFVLDTQDKVVRVLAPDGAHLFDFGRTGEGPGEFQSPWSIDSIEGQLFVFDRTRRVFKVFDLSGNYSHQLTLPRLGRYTRNIIFTAPDQFLISTTSIGPGMFGYGVHQFRIDGAAGGSPEVRYVKSYGELPKLEPAIYEAAVSANIELDLDGGVIFNLRAPYSIRKFSPDGELLWRIDDPELIRPVTEYLSVDDHGRVQVNRHPLSSWVLPVEQDLYLHIILRPPTDPAQYADTTDGIPPIWKREVEMIDRREGGPPIRVRFQFNEVFHLHGRDADGRLYGTYGEVSPKLIRSTVYFDRLN